MAGTAFAQDDICVPTSFISEHCVFRDTPLIIDNCTKAVDSCIPADVEACVGSTCVRRDVVHHPCLHYMDGCVPDYSIWAGPPSACGQRSTSVLGCTRPSGFEYTYCGEFDGRKTRAHDWCYAEARRYYTENLSYYPYESEYRWEHCAAFNNASNWNTVRKSCGPHWGSWTVLYCDNAFGDNDLRLAAGVGNRDDRARTLDGFATNDDSACNG
ncbi:MAG TPA: hypothetical protein VHF89_15810 [Solirubrobacteraceae bacterium]|nr:hypothetical protein [Solirubrobacteraceae bacterium]